MRGGGGEFICKTTATQFFLNFKEQVKKKLQIIKI